MAIVEVIVGEHRVVRSSGTDNKREARADGRKIEDELKAQAGKPRKQELTLDQACARYWIEKGRHLKSADSEQRHLRQIISRLGTSVRLSDVANQDVALVAQSILRSGNGPAAVNRCLAAFRQVLRRAQRLWGFDVRPIHWPDHFQKEPKGRTRWLTKDEALRLLAVSPEPLALAIEWSLQTGTRKGETYGIEPRDVDFDRGQVTVRGKTGKGIIWLTPETRAILLRCDLKGRYVFDRRNQRKLFAAAVKAAGLEDFTWHDLRHTHATWLRQGGAPLEIVQRSLRHASITTTQRYAHVDDQEVKRALEQLPTLSTNSTAGGNVIPLRRKRKS
jgi:integrase